MTRSLVKLVDYSLLPAAVLVVGKFLGLYLTIQIFSLNWGIRNIPNSLFSVRPVFYPQDVLIASTYSDLFMYLLVMIGFSVVLVQAVIFHNSHISPIMLSRLANHNLIGLVKGSFEIYHKAAMWGVFLWVANGLILLNVLSNKTEAWVFIFSAATSIILNIVMLRDVANEIELSKKNTKLSL